MSQPQRVFPDSTRPPAAPLSPAVAWERLVFASGQVPRGADGEIVTGIDAQTAIVLDNLEQVLRAAGATLSSVVKTVVYLTDIGDMPRMNEIYRDRFGAELPARTTVAVAALGNPTYLVEIEAVAIKHH